MTKSL